MELVVINAPNIKIQQLLTGMLRLVTATLLYLEKYLWIEVSSSTDEINCLENRVGVL